ncbi:MAG: M14 family metallopeptidase [Gammaproteobacteria bacterium]|nr:M14 family metallopeptidase [Gammaproteobacteria bacterium]
MLRQLVPLFIGLLILGQTCLAQSPGMFTEDMITAAELSNFERTSTFKEVVDVLDALAANTSLMHRESLLLTKEGRDVPMVVLARPPVTSPAQAEQSGKPVIYIQGNIHGGEVEGKEASLIVMRDILYGDKQHLLDNQVIVFVPIYNADGNDAMAADTRPNQEQSPVMAGIRTAHGYDLNRDGMIVESDETAALYAQVIQRWDPDLLVDLHTTNGTWHGYSLTYAPSYHTAGDKATSDYSSDIMLPAIQQLVKDKFGLEFNWYGRFDYHDFPPTEYRTYHHAPRYLTNYMGLRNRMAILSETFSHDRFYKRVHVANAFVEEILEYTNRHGDEIQRINREADQRAAVSAMSRQRGVQFQMVPREESLNLLTYSYIPFTSQEGVTNYVRSAELVTTPGVLNYNAFEPTKTAIMPNAYVFNAYFSELAEKLLQHGIEVDVLTTDSTFEGQVFLIDAIDKQDYVQNGHRNTLLSGQFRSKTQTFSPGDYLVSMDHRLAYLIFYLLEPESDDGLAYWNLLDDYLEERLQEEGQVEYPVFKVMR